jgi:hypothetical protein
MREEEHKEMALDIFNLIMQFIGYLTCGALAALFTVFTIYIWRERRRERRQERIRQQAALQARLEVMQARLEKIDATLHVSQDVVAYIRSIDEIDLLSSQP